MTLDTAPIAVREDCRVTSDGLVETSDILRDTSHCFAVSSAYSSEIRALRTQIRFVNGLLQ